MSSGLTLALVGVTGGAGTTRLTVEFGATLARAGREVALVDAAFATQGLATHVPGRIDPDVTGLLVEDAQDPAAGLVELPVEVPGRVAALPARAPFERLARAKSPSAAQRFEDVLAALAERFEYVIVDTPPVAANQAVAAVTAADRVGLVAPATDRGADRLAVMRDRLRDVGAPAECTIANRADGERPLGGADARIPESEARAVADLPASAEPDPEFAPAVAAAVETAVDGTLDLSFPEAGLL